MHELMKKASPEAIASNKAEMEEWEAEFERLQALRPVQATRDRIKGMDLPALEAQIKEQEASYPEISDEAEKVTNMLSFTSPSLRQYQALEKLDSVKRQLKDISILKDHAKTVSRLQREAERAEQEVSNLESDLSATGSTKTADNVQEELNDLSTEL